MSRTCILMLRVSGCGAGFFADADADAKARGQAPPKQAAEQDYDSFMASLAADVRELEAREEQAAENAAQERAEREAFEQRYRTALVQRWTSCRASHGCLWAVTMLSVP